MARFIGILLLAAVVSTSAEAQFTPVCRLGTANAVNPNRQLAPGDTVFKATGGPAIVSYREAPGSSHILYLRCIIPQGTEMVCGIGGCWIRVCGNEAKQPEGWSFPFLPGSRGTTGATGAAGPAGPMGPQGPAGPMGRTSPQDRKRKFVPIKDDRWFCARHPWVCTGAVAVAGGLIWNNNRPAKIVYGPGGKTGPAF